MTYDALGNRLKQTAVVYGSGSAPDASRQVTFTYDTAHSPASTNRDVLTEEKSILYDAGSAAYNDVYDNPFGYDAAYNPTAFALGGTALSLPVNNDNQINLGGFSFDGSGNPTTYQSATFGFDPEDRLTSISSPAFSAAYDGDGLRIKKTAASVTTYYLYDGGSPVVEETWNGSAASLSAVNVLSGDGWRSRYYVGGQFYSFSFDPQGNVVQKQYGQNFGPVPYSLASFEAYGRRGGEYDNGGHSPALHQDPAGFGGQFGYYTDVETGLLCLTHRYYDPGTGKFLNRDPIGYAGGANLYGFADGNPVNESDPSGTDGVTGGITLLGIQLLSKIASSATKILVDSAYRHVFTPIGHAIHSSVMTSYEMGDPPIQVAEPPTGVPSAISDPDDEEESVRSSDSPHYSVIFEANLHSGTDYPGRTEEHHFSVSNGQLHRYMQEDSGFAAEMERMYPGIVGGVAPGVRNGFPPRPPTRDLTWHHHPTRPGVMQLIPRVQHRAPGAIQNSLHPNQRGGMENWGGGR